MGYQFEEKMGSKFGVLGSTYPPPPPKYLSVPLPQGLKWRLPLLYLPFRHQGEEAQCLHYFSFQQQFPSAPMPPPPAPVNSSDVSHDNDALASMLMAWYLSGYHTGYYQVRTFTAAFSFMRVAYQKNQPVCLLLPDLTLN